jgi:hypothetical protein
MTEHSTEQHDFNIVHGGLFDHFVRRAGLVPQTPRRRLVKVFSLFLVTWVPLLVLSCLTGHAWGDHNQTGFLRDPEVHARFVVTLPLLELAEVMVASSLVLQVRHLRVSGLVPPQDLDRFDAARHQALTSRGSFWLETAIVLAAVTLAIVMRGVFGIGVSSNNWERTNGQFTLPGGWYALVSTPILYYFLIRWVSVFLIWARFLWRLSRLNLQLTPTHPDRSGGVGFLAWGLSCFTPVVMAVSTVFSAAFAEEILHRGQSLDSLKYHVGVYVLCVLVIMHLPLLFFATRLTRTRFRGLLEFGALVWKYDRAYEEKWLEHADAANSPEFLGNSDVQTLADIATPYDHIREMRMVPFDSKSFMIVAIAAALPMLPLVGTEIPLQEILSKLGEFVI